MRILLVASAFLLAAGSAWASANEEIKEADVAVENDYEAKDVAPSPPNTLMRLKSGVSFSSDEGNSSSRVPVTLDWMYVGFGNLGIGASFSSVGLFLGGVDYRYQRYPIRFTAGLRAGNFLYRNPDTQYGENRLALGPAANFDYSVSGPFFANASVEYLFAENSTQVGSFQVGFGAEF